MRGFAVFCLLGGAALFAMGAMGAGISRDTGPLASIYVPLQASINMVGFFACMGIAAVLWCMPERAKDQA